MKNSKKPRAKIEVPCAVTFDEGDVNRGINDEFCNDQLNVPECNYDSEKCCGSVDLLYCEKCKCKDPRNKDKRGNNDSL